MNLTKNQIVRLLYAVAEDIELFDASVREEIRSLYKRIGIDRSTTGIQLEHGDRLYQLVVRHQPDADTAWHIAAVITDIEFENSQEGLLKALLYDGWKEIPSGNADWAFTTLTHYKRPGVFVCLDGEEPHAVVLRRYVHGDSSIYLVYGTIRYETVGEVDERLKIVPMVCPYGEEPLQPFPWRCT